MADFCFFFCLLVIFLALFGPAKVVPDFSISSHWVLNFFQGNTPVAVKGKPKRSTEQDRISELEKALALSRQREQLYLRVITVSSEEIGEDLLKKTGLGLLNPSVKKDG